MEFHNTDLAQQVVFGPGAFDRLSEAVDRFHWQRFLLCTSPSARKSGPVERIEKSLTGRLVAVFDHTQSHVPDFQVGEALDLAAENEVDAIIGLGGGSPIGLAKAVSVALEEKRTGRAVKAATPTDQPLIPVIAIPTTYAGSEMTPVYGITHHSGGEPRKQTVSNPKIAPKLVIYDPQLTLDLPPLITASTGINALAHCVEAVYSISRNPLSTAAALYAARSIAHALPRCYAHGDDLAARSEMLAGSYLAGKALAGVALGLHHGICHVLGGTMGVPHGIANAIMLPLAMEFNLDATTPELAELARSFGLEQGEQSDEQLAQAAVQWVMHLIKEMNLPQHLREYSVQENDLAHLAELGAQSTAVQNNPKPANAEQIEALLRRAW